MSDDIKLSYLEIKESKPKHYSILLKTPISAEGERLPIDIIMPKDCNTISPKKSKIIKGSNVSHWQSKCSNGLSDSTIVANGLKETGIDLLLRLEFLSGKSNSILLNPSMSSYHTQKKASTLEIAQTYGWLGVTHILFGFDHILFVFALLLIVKNVRRLIWTITAFTVAHSLTMAIATLDIIKPPQAPVEAIIALSILFLAIEIMNDKKGKVGLTSQYPWLIAFIFGLLHGFGFAGALAEIGLPQQAVVFALFLFNIGVELGQLLFVATIVSIVLLLQRLLSSNALGKVKTSIVYMMGGISTFWLIERILSF